MIGQVAAGVIVGGVVLWMLHSGIALASAPDGPCESAKAGGWVLLIAGVIAAIWLVAANL